MEKRRKRAARKKTTAPGKNRPRPASLPDDYQTSGQEREVNLWLEGVHGDDFPDTWFPLGKTFKQIRPELPPDWSPSRPYTALTPNLLVGLPEEDVLSALSRIGVPKQTLDLIFQARMFGFDRAVRKSDEYNAPALDALRREYWNKSGDTHLRPVTAALLKRLREQIQPAVPSAVWSSVIMPIFDLCRGDLTDDEIKQREVRIDRCMRLASKSLTELEHARSSHPGASLARQDRWTECVFVLVLELLACAKRNLERDRDRPSDLYAHVVTILDSLRVPDRDQREILLDMGFTASRTGSGRLRNERARLRRNNLLGPPTRGARPTLNKRSTP